MTQTGWIHEWLTGILGEWLASKLEIGFVALHDALPEVLTLVICLMAAAMMVTGNVHKWLARIVVCFALGAIWGIVT